MTTTQYHYPSLMGELPPSVRRPPRFKRSQEFIFQAVAGLVLLISLCPCLAAPPTKAVGIVIYTDSRKDDNAYAKVFEYHQLLNSGGGIQVKGADGRPYEITNSSIKAIVPYPGYATGAKSSPQAMAAKLSETMQTYPSSKRFLQPWLDTLQNSSAGRQDDKTPAEQGVTLTLKSGRAYLGCRLKGIETGPVAVIAHSGGLTRISIDQIDEKTSKALNGTNPEWNLGPATWGKQEANGLYQYALENGPVLAGVRLKEIKDGKTAIVSHSKGEMSFNIGKLTTEDCKILNGTNPEWNLGPATWGKRASNGLYQYAVENGPVLIDMTLSEIKDGRTVVVSHSKGELSFEIGKLTNDDRRILNGSTKRWNLGPAAWGTRGATGVYDRYAFANSRVLSSVKIEQVSVAGFKLKHSEGEITVPLDDLLLPPATDPIHGAIQEVLAQQKRHGEVVEECKQNDAALWKAESKAFVPLRTPWVTLMVPKIFKFSTVEIDDSFQMQSVVAKYNHEKCPILGVGSPVSGEQTLIITIRKDVDELLYIPFLTEDIQTDARDEFVAEATRGEMHTCGGHSYHVYQNTSKTRLKFDYEAPDARMWHSSLNAYPIEKGLPVIRLSLWTASSEELAKQAPLLLKMVDSMIVEKSDSQLVLGNWKMNRIVSDTYFGRLRPPDILLDLLWRQGRPPEILQRQHTRNLPANRYANDAFKYQPVNKSDQLPWLGCHIDQVWANFGLKNTRRLEGFELFSYNPSWLQFSSNGKASYALMTPLGSVTGLCDRAGRVIAFQVDLPGSITDSDNKEKDRDITKDDLRLLMESCLPSFAVTTTKLVLRDGKKRPDVAVEGVTFEDQGIEVYSTKDESVFAALDFGSKTKGGADFRPDMRILFLRPEASGFLKKHGFNLSKVYPKSEAAAMRNEWKSPSGCTTPVVESEMTTSKEAAEIEDLQHEGVRPGEVRVVTLDGEVKMKVCWIPPGKFIMGSPAGPDGNNPEAKVEVTISKGFWMARTEVTVDQWRAGGGADTLSRPLSQVILDYGDHKAMWRTDGTSFRNKNGPLPAERMDWEEADGWCKALTEHQRKAGRLPKGWRYDLPTEAQWEYACRAGTTTSLNNGKNLIERDSRDRECKDLEEIAWCATNSGGEKHIVATKRPNAWGLYDMHGNVFEFCRDVYAQLRNMGSVDPVQTTPDPRWEGKGKSADPRVHRGGAWDCRESRWFGSESTAYGLRGDRNYHTGFRPVLVPPGL